MITLAAAPQRALAAGPDARVTFTEAYARHVARDAYFWTWPLVAPLCQSWFRERLK